ncbi:MAG: hypothetical protein RIQ79_104, partial [Verrucomicrobiota bacterium]
MFSILIQVVSKKLFRNTRFWIGLGSVVTALIWSVVAYVGFLEPVEQLTVDSRFWLRGPLPSPLKVVYVDIDSDAILEHGSWPWDRRIFAKVCDVLIKKGKAKAIGIDVVFSEAGVPN